MAISSPQEYQKKEMRLEEIKTRLETIAKEERANIAEVIELKTEASILAKDLTNYLKSVLATKE